jgi:UDP-N-acetylmuramate dehydrogenase
VHVLADEPLQKRNTLALKSNARAYVSVSSEQAVQQALEWASDHQMRAIALGQGSNIVLAGELDALVIQQAQKGIEVIEEDDKTVLVRVAAGESWHELVVWALGRGFYGLENLALIPGTVGAAPIQNIGAYGVELASFVHHVSAIHIESRERLTLSAERCEFGYRDSVFKRVLRDKLIITGVDLVLQKSPQPQLSYPALKDFLLSSGIEDPTPEVIFDAVVNIRQSRLPNPEVMPNVGSFFKNPVVIQDKLEELIALSSAIPSYPQANGTVKLPAAWLIDQCGWKGKRVGCFGVHPEHALVLVNYGGGSGLELLKLAQEISISVKDTYEIELEIEPRVYGLE